MENCQYNKGNAAGTIQNMEQEQTRSQQLAQRGKLNKGLFGWIWKR